MFELERKKDVGRFGHRDRAWQGSSLRDQANRGAGATPATCGPQGRHGVALWELPSPHPGDLAEPWGPHLAEEARREVHLSGVDFPGKGRVRSFWCSLRQEGKWRPGTVPSPAFIQFNQQLLWWKELKPQSPGEGLL